jgi:hypothetical protein
MASRQVIIRYQYVATATDGPPISASLQASVPGASEDSVIKYLRDRFPDRTQLQILELIWK